MAKKITSKSTKNDILEAYEELQREKADLEKALKQSTRSSAPSVPSPPQSQPNSQPRSQPTSPSEPAPMTLKPNPQMDQILELLNQLQHSFGSAISTLSEKLIAEATQLTELQFQFQLERQQLQDLHDITVEDITLEALIETYEARSKAFDQELRQKREERDLALQQARKTWLKEQEDHARFVQERNATHKKLQQREAEEYKYALELQRRLATEEFEQQQQALYQDLEEREAAQKKQWAEREAQIAEQEQKFTELKARVEAMEQEREAALKKAREEGKGIAYHQAKVKSDLKGKEVEGQKQIYELRLHSLQETIQTQEARTQNLSNQLDAALKQVQDLAVKAIEGTSNLNQSQVLREIALEQAKQVKSK